jgi:molybdenum cofactor cytidylyltransferase
LFHRSSVAGIVLAAGMSKRFGANKLVALWRGKPLIRWVVQAALGSRLERVVVVLGHESALVRSAFADLFEDDRLKAIANAAYRTGQSSSVIAGLEAVRTDFPAAMFLMGDQPMLDAGVIDGLISAYERSGKAICLPSYNGTRRNPVIFAKRFYPDILALSGDTGARALIDANPDDVASVEFAQEWLFHDVDIDADLQKLTARNGSRNSAKIKTTCGD